MRIKETQNKKLLVEGNDDQHVVWALCKKFHIRDNFDVIDCQGIENIYNQIPIRFKQSNINTLGIIIDADSDIKIRWNEARKIFNNQGYAFCDEIPKEGLIIHETGLIKIGIWIMPNNDTKGMLEDFISFLVEEGDELFPIVKEYLAEIEKKSLNKYSSIHKSKALIHSWLSIQEDPGISMGLAITKRYLSTEDEVCLLFVDWLRKLYE